MKFLLLLQFFTLALALKKTKEGGENDEVVPLIIGGRAAKANSFPFMAAVLREYKSKLHLICTGFLTSATVAVTAGHCFRGFEYLTDYVLRIGDVDHRFGESYGIRKLLVTKEYVDGSSYGDISIMVLDRPVTTAGIRFIRLPTPEMSSVNFDGYSAIVLGWGRQTATGKTTNKLRYLDDLTIVSSEQCQAALFAEKASLRNKYYKGFDELICAGHKEEGKDSCKGDSGAPLIVNYQGYMYAIGSVSYGVGCALPNLPAVHMKLALYLDAIKNPEDRRHEEKFYVYD